MVNRLLANWLNLKKTPFIQELVAIPWGHNVAIIAKCEAIEEAFFTLKILKLITGTERYQLAEKQENTREL